MNHEKLPPTLEGYTFEELQPIAWLDLAISAARRQDQDAAMTEVRRLRIIYRLQELEDQQLVRDYGLHHEKMISDYLFNASNHLFHKSFDQAIDEFEKAKMMIERNVRDLEPLYNAVNLRPPPKPQRSN